MLLINYVWSLRTLEELEGLQQYKLTLKTILENLANC
jgi:hypothetical protein